MAAWVQRPEVREHVPRFGLNTVLITGLQLDPWCPLPHIIRDTVGLKAKLGTHTHTHTQSTAPLICIYWRHAIDPSISTTHRLMKSSLRDDGGGGGGGGSTFANTQDEEGHGHFGRLCVCVCTIKSHSSLHITVHSCSVCIRSTKKKKNRTERKTRL